LPKKARELSAIEVKRLAKQGRHPVGGVPGLLLSVNGATSRSWILRAQVGRQRRDFGLGGYPETGLAQAREKARDLKEMIRSGIDPALERKKARKVLLVSQEKSLTFSEAAHRCHAARETEFRSQKHRNDWINSLTHHAFPWIADVSVADVELPHVLQVLEPIWHTRTETATRVRQRMEGVLTWATVRGYRSGENPARWIGNLKEVLPNPSKIAKKSHYRALPWQEITTFMTELKAREAIAARALEFAILTAARSGEVRFATWNQIDLNKRIWSLHSKEMKAGRAHRVPLSSHVVALLTALPRMEGSPYVFVAPRGGPFSDMAISKLLKRMGVDATVHGFRSTFKDWARSCTSYPDELSELALAHVSNDATRAAYARDELIPQRDMLMQDWAAFCNGDKKFMPTVKHR